jgi:ribosome modulation factor
MFRSVFRNIFRNIFRDDSFEQSSPAYQLGYQDGYCGRLSSPEKCPGQEDEYCKGHRKGWNEGYPGQYRTMN